MTEPEIRFNGADEPDPTIRWRAWRMWTAEGRPFGREREFLQLARELQAADDRPVPGPLPNFVHVVDDDEAVRDSLQALLETSGYYARKWASGVDLLRALPGLEPGCIVLDVRMPDMDGLAVLAELRARNIKLPVIVITGHGDIPLAVQAMRTGAFDFIEKPFAREFIIETVRLALQRR